MAEYIEREAFIEWLKHIPLIDLSDGHGLCRVIMEDDFKKAIKEMTKGIIADVAPVRHGRWLLITAWYRNFVWCCSECGRSVSINCDEELRQSKLEKEYPFCHCGAKMDLGEEGGSNETDM